ncbi:16S rRNA (adenine(1518)-N(6)/adenine(1519)-N(6))-dimethyltransferase RsmA [Parachlamydia sp. AcF125]|uniref:16S rRNA (adenine(1518)-N(6)/adenine(1519)-N(6))- dimethyltransferase RsmA n=1 Tax=Parachlamydia sp. AcF125 TaxID=2795736 RepID=UPI001BC93D37|nr:16S rRNA (adenine(1518)-N(6)/adenine(1519)-N(6))-dimethyltransferase RsmA [Parachlamydia sp. AcF125]MBS4167387.1 Ribosomal RNA small subunit methyltransferase A [Parachlamydia sp. AcF125]
MPLYKPNELFAFLNSLGIRPKKGLSQNFLIDGNILRKILAAAAVNSDDVILEIGPGPGSLTECLLAAGTKVIAVEKDIQLAEALIRLQTPLPSLQVYCEDILDFPIENTLQPALKEGKKAKVIANLPYHLTSSILSELVPLHNLFSTITVMVQEEVARRFTASPGSREYSAFTVFLNFFSHPTYNFKVGKQCFYPAPKVDSAVITLQLKSPPKVDQQDFFALTRKAFEQRRKMLKSALKPIYKPSLVAEALMGISLNPMARAEDLSLEDYLKLFAFLEKMAI